MGWCGFAGQAFRTHRLIASSVTSILSLAPHSCLDEYTERGQPPGVTAMHMLCGGADRFAEREQIVRELVRLAASVNMKHRTTGATPLLRAAGGGSPHLVSLLIELRADANVANNEGLAPLDAAARSNSEASQPVLHSFAFLNSWGCVDWIGHDSWHKASWISPAFCVPARAFWV